MRLNGKSGFTLVELALVMVIIGLLIGGIIKGMELVENGQVTGVIAQVKSYDAAVAGFRDVYGAKPGDLVDAGNKLPGCNDSCTGLEANGAGNGRVGLENWDGGGNDNFYSPPQQETDEFNLFWFHLQKANFVNGVADVTSLGATTPHAFGKTFPAARTGGGFLVGEPSSNAGAFPMNPSTSAYAGGLSLIIAADAMNQSDKVDAASGTLALTPARAGQIDRKMDDGMPKTGAVIGYGPETCANTDGSGMAYQEATGTKNCILIVKIQH